MPPLNKLQKTGLALAISQSVCLSVCASAHAATITVTSDQDDGSGCTLREAIASANTSANQNNGCALGSDAGTDTITFSNSLASNTIALANGELSIGAGKNVDIDASNVDGGITIDGNFQSRLLNINDSTVSMNSISLTRGGFEGGIGNSQGAVQVEGATLTLANSTLSNNKAVTYANMFYAYRSALTMTNVSIRDNSYTGYESYSVLSLLSCPSVTLNNLVINNSQSNLYALSIEDSNTVLITASTISSNTIGSSNTLNIRGSDSVTMSNITVSENTSDDYVMRINNNSSFTIGNSTISSNAPTGSSATSVFSITNTDLTLLNTTVNDPAFRSNFRLSTSPNYARPTQISVVNSIVTDSLNGPDCVIGNGDASLNDFSSDTNSIMQGAGCNTQARQVDPLLGPLADNGGPTFTHSLLAGSPAINTGDNATCLATDQRSINRDRQCDVGAFEFVEDGGFFVIPLNNGKAVVIPE